jgi:prepilin-type N-terminal cleavage/methylation domain-containing protein
MKKINKGFTLIEVVVSMALLILVFGGLIGVMILSQETKISTKNNLIANNLAQEGIDLVRFIRDQNYNNKEEDVFLGIYTNDGKPYSFTIMTDSGGLITIDAFSDGSVKNSDALKIFNHRYIYTADLTAINTPFRRLITTTYNAGATPPHLAVKSEVYWQSDNKQNTITIQDELTDWRP